MDELNLSSEDFRKLLEGTIDWLTGAVQRAEADPPTYMSSLSQQECPEGYAAARDLTRRLRESDAPEEGSPLDDILNIVCKIAPKAGVNTASGGFGAFIVGGGLLHTAVADLVSGCMNQYLGAFTGSPGYVQLESNVIRWMAKILGYDQESFGCFTSGASMANFVGILVARRRHLSEEELVKADVMITQESHTCIPKGLMMAGLPQSSIRNVACDSSWRMDPSALEEEIISSTAKGRHPFLAVATAGTTNAGTVDNLRQLSAVCKRHGVWLHVDGAYGAAFNLTERGKVALDGLAEADSIAVDLHKSFFLPFATGMILVKNKIHLQNAFRLQGDAPYYPEFDADDVNFTEISPELSRSFRGLRIWLPLQLCGLKKWRDALDDRLDWIAYFHARLEGLVEVGVEIVTPPSLSIMTFRYVPRELQAVKGPSESENDMSNLEQRRETINRQLLQFINSRKSLFLSSTTLPSGKFVIRICILHLRMTRSRLDAGLVDLQAGIEHIKHHVTS